MIGQRGEESDATYSLNKRSTETCFWDLSTMEIISDFYKNGIDWSNWNRSLEVSLKENKTGGMDKCY